MRLFEWLILLALLPGVCYNFSPHRKKPRWVDALSLITVLLIGVHLVLEGVRWQMAPAYILSLILALFAVRRLRGEETRATWRLPSALLSGVMSALAWGLSLLLSWLIPVLDLAAPSGPYAIGTVTYHWVDENRPEPFTEDTTDVREMMVQIWYPAIPNAEQPRARYIEDITAAGPAIADRFNLPSFIFDHVSLIKTHARTEAPVAEDEALYPIILSSHGHHGFRVQNTFQIEHLVSHGFIVVAPDHTYDAVATVFPDERTVLAKRTTPADSLGQTLAALRHDELQIRVADVQFLLDQLARVQSGELATPLAGKLDLEMVGIFGHSFGAATAVAAAGQEPRLSAALALDLWTFPLVHRFLETDSLRVPFLSLRGDPGLGDRNNARIQPLMTRTKEPAYALAIRETNHYNFSDLPLLTPLAPRIGLAGPTDIDAAFEIINDYMLSFFKYYLQGRPAPLLDQPETYEAIFVDQ